MIYRKDIQILRGVAVLLVVLFHLQIGGIESGFLGVDIFFVISGFLMAILYDPAKKSEFFLRRSKRLLPTYYVIILLTLAVSIFITIPNEFDQVSKQSIYATFFSSNIGFWMQNSYFSKAEFNPLLHLWSLGVEIQFYLIVPFIYWVFKRVKISLPLVLLLSLMACFFIVGISPKTSFFMMPLRLWEFLMGYGVAIYFTNNGNIRNASLHWLGVIAMILLISIPTFNLNGESLGFIHGHPGLFALLVSLATSIVLAFGIPKLIEKSRIGSFLELIGKYSYSIYLVHFPVIVLFLYEPFSGTILKTNNVNQIITLLSIIITLSILIYHLIEDPARHAKKIIRNLLIVSPFVFILIFLGYTFQQSKFLKKELAIFNAWKDRAPYRCGKLIRILEPNALTCDLTNNIKNPTQKILLVGDSHADAIKSTFASVANELNVDVHFMVSNIPLLNGGVTPISIINEALSKDIDTVVLHYFLPTGIDNTNILEFINLANNNNLLVAYIMPVPVWDQHIPKTLYNHLKYNELLPVQTSKNYKYARKDLYTNLKNIGKEHCLIYDVVDFFCTEDCKIINLSGSPYYFDEHHLTITGSELLRPLFHRIITDTINIQQLEYTN